MKTEFVFIYPLIHAKKSRYSKNTSQETRIANKHSNVKTEQSPVHKKTSDSCTSILMTGSRTCHLLVPSNIYNTLCSILL